MYGFLFTTVGAAAIVTYGFGCYFRNTPLPFVGAVTALQLSSFIVWTFYLAPAISPLRRVPLAKQPPWWKTYLAEPMPQDMKKFMDETPNNGLIRYFGAFHGERLLVTKPEGTKEMMLSKTYNFNKMPVVTLLVTQLTGNGLVVAEQDDHKRQRMSLQPAFKYKYVKDLFPKFWLYTKRLLTALVIEYEESSYDNYALIDMERWVQRATLDVVASAGFGVEINAINEPGGKLARLLPLANSTSPRANAYRLLGFLLPPWLYHRLPLTRRYELEEMTQALEAATLPMIQARREHLHGRNVDAAGRAGEQKKGLPIYAATDIISTILKFREPFTDMELMAQSATMFVAGQDTTSGTIIWALYLLAHTLDVQNRLRSEIRGYLPSPHSNNETIDAPLLESLPLLAAVCSETLRLFMPAPSLARQVTKPGTTLLGQHVPVGTLTLTSLYGTHRMKTVWGDDAEDFKPDRFLQRDGEGNMKFDAYAGLQGGEAVYRYMPFGVGPRSCIGERFARGEFASLLAGLIGRFEFSPVDPKKKIYEDVTINFALVIKPEGGMPLRIRRVEGW